MVGTTVFESRRVAICVRIDLMMMMSLGFVFALDFVELSHCPNVSIVGVIYLFIVFANVGISRLFLGSLRT